MNPSTLHAYVSQGLLHGSGHRTQRGLVQHDVDVAACLDHGVGVDDVPLQKVAPVGRGARGRDGLVDVAAVSRGEIVERHDLLSQRKQPLEQVGSDETGGPGDQPSSRGRFELFAGEIIGGFHARHVMLEVAGGGTPPANARATRRHVR